MTLDTLREARRLGPEPSKIRWYFPQASQIPAKAASGRSLLRPNQTGVFLGLVSLYSLKLVSGTKQRCCGFSQARQNGEATLRTLVTG
jgi:hypothetical protein